MLTFLGFLFCLGVGYAYWRARDVDGNIIGGRKERKKKNEGP